MKKNKALQRTQAMHNFYKELGAPAKSKLFKDTLQESFARIDDPDPTQDWLNETLIHDVPRAVMEEAIWKNRFTVDDSVTYDSVSANPDDWDEFTEHKLLEGRMFLWNTATRYLGD